MKLSNLMLRTITAIVLVLLVFGGMFYLSSQAFLLCSCAVFLWASWEWSLLTGIRQIAIRVSYVLTTGVVMYASLSIPIHILFLLGVLLWILMLLNLLQYSGYFIKFSGILSLAVAWKGVHYLCFLAPRPWKLIELFLIVWVADIAAYFVGRAYGKRKLAPAISPHKTIEGAMGAVFAVTILSACMFLSFRGIMLSLLTLLACILGDLFESSLKRRENLKDSGNVLPGHGGILDRIDSLIAAIPVFGLGVIYYLH